MDYIYEGTLEKVDGDWFVSVPQLEGAYGGGRSIQKACRNAAEALRLAIADVLAEGERLPRAKFSCAPQIVLCVEVDETYIAETSSVSVKQAAERLCVSCGRVSQLLTAGCLEPVFVDGKRRVSLRSIEKRLSNPPEPHRPKSS